MEFAMARTHGPAASIAALAVYLAAIVGGALHHHAHGADKHNALSDLPVYSGETSPQSCDDDSHDCAICAAVQLAKASPPRPVVVTSTELVRESASSDAILPPICFRATAHARAPPSL
jgi:hypothetical protein